MPEITHQPKHTETRAYYMGNEVQTGAQYPTPQGFMVTEVVLNGSVFIVPTDLVETRVVEVE